jgi:site-specific DNA recombinase
MMMPVPAIDAAAVLAAVQERAQYLRQGLVRCRGWGSTYDGIGIRHQAAQGKARD